MRKQAIGIAINGRDVKIAQLIREKNEVAVAYLQNAVLSSDLDNEALQGLEENAQSQLKESKEDLFGLDKPPEVEEPVNDNNKIQENANVLYALLKKFTAHKVKIAFNVSPANVSYQDLNTTLDYDKNVSKGNLLKKIEKWKSGFNSLDNVSVITRGDGTLCNVALESTQQPIILTLLEQLNTYFKGNLLLSSMVPNEVALVNLVKKSYTFKDEEEITAIIQFEEEYSRIVFMKGSDFLTVSPMITEGHSHELLEVIYSKIIFELDNLNISKVENILLSSQTMSDETVKYFETKFPHSRVGYIVSQPLAEQLSSQFNRDDLSEFAIPISLAWEILDHKDKTFSSTNLIPNEILDRQKLLKLSVTGYMLIALLGLSTFFFTAQIMNKKVDIRSLEKENRHYEEQIANNAEIVERVHLLDKQISNLMQSLVLSDSLGKGFDNILTFLENTNKGILSTKSVWIDQIQSTQMGFLIKGNSKSRANIPQLSNKLGETILRKVTRTEGKNQKLYEFELEVSWPPKDMEVEKKRWTPEKLASLTENVSPLEELNVDSKIEKISKSSVKRENKTKIDIYKEKFTDMAKAGLDVNPLKDSDKGKKEIKNNYKDSDSASKNIQKIDLPIKNADFQTTNNNDKSKQYPFKNQKSVDQGKSIKQDLQSATQKSQKQTQKTSVLPKQTNYVAPLTIHISSHAVKFTADREVAFFKARGFNAYIRRVGRSNQDVYYRVCSGQFQSYEEALKKLNEMNRKIHRKYFIGSK